MEKNKKNSEWMFNVAFPIIVIGILLLMFFNWIVGLIVIFGGFILSIWDTVWG